MVTLPIGKRLKLARIARGVSQRDLARDADVTQSTLSLIENDYREPRERELRAILSALGTTIDELSRLRV